MEENAVFLAFLSLPLVLGYGLFRFFRRRRLDTRPVSWPQLACGNLLVLSFLLSLLLLGGETYFRFFYDATDSFGLTKTTQQWFDRHYHINSSGFRDSLADYPLKMAPGRRRITFLGDSFTAAHGVKDVEQRFANRIRSEHPEWEIHVLAECGWDTGQELLALEDAETNGYLLDVENYDLDVVVLVYCLNDVADIDPQWAALTGDARRFSTLGHLAEHSYCLNTLYWRLRVATDPQLADYYGFLERSYQGDVWRRQQERLKALRDLVRRRCGRLLVVTFPFLHDLDADYQLAHAHSQLDGLWNRLDVPHLDLLPLFRSHDPSELVVNKFDAHPNEFAHGIAAKAIAGFLQRHIAE